MAIINFVVPPLQARQFSGGIYCISRYALGLRRLGHQVNFIPLLPSPYPQWIGGDFGWTPEGSLKARWRAVGKDMVALLGWPGGRQEPRRRSREIKQQLVSSLLLLNPRLLTPMLERSLKIGYVGAHIPDADVTVATSFDSALAVRLKGRGRLFYFAQHYEPFFAGEMPEPSVAEQEAVLSYRLGLRMIANSSWLQAKLKADACVDAALCPNAIDHSVFTGDVKPARQLREVRIISYGGRNAVWKGFAEMAEAVRLARTQLPDYQLRWQVYGSSLLPPDNPVAPYESLGFLQPPALAQAYRSADLLLSASWYESFPLFPIEAMACGLPVITTQPGTEEYAISDQTAAVVEPRNANSVAQAIVRLVTDVGYRDQLARQGQQRARDFNWQGSVATMEKLLLQQ